MEIYKPAEDSFLFQDFLDKYLSKNKVSSHLDIGTGSGILVKTSSKFLKNENILATDINKNAVEELKKQGFNAIHSNLFKNIKGKFDLITFNAPYLPEDRREPRDSQISTTGGKRGDEVAVKFLKQTRSHLNKGGKIFLLISSLTPIGKINEFNPKTVARKKLFQEELFILEFSK